MVDQTGVVFDAVGSMASRLGAVYRRDGSDARAGVQAWNAWHQGVVAY